MYYEDTDQKKTAYLVHERGSIKIRILINGLKMDETLFSWPKEYFTGNGGIIIPRKHKDKLYLEYMNLIIAKLHHVELVLPHADSIEDMRILYKRQTPKILDYKDSMPSSKYQNFQTALKQFVKICGNKRISEYSKKDLEAFDKKLAEKGLSPNSAKTYHAQVQTIFTKAKQDSYIKESPYKNFKSRIAGSKTVRELVVATPSQVEALWQHWSISSKGPMKQAITALLLQCYTGARIEDALRIQPSDFDKGFFVAKKNKAKCSLILSEANKRLIPYLPIGLSYNQAKYRIDQLSNFLGFKIQSHGMRRYFATQIAESNNLFIAQKALGHSSMSMTEKYIFTDDKKVREAIERFGTMDPQ